MKYTVVVWAVAASFGLLCNAAPLEKRGIKSCYTGGKAAFTQYWIPKEGTKDMLNDGKIVTLTGAKSQSLKTPGGKVLAKVSKVTYEKCQMEGTCLLSNGELINLDSGENTFEKVNTQQHPYGLGNTDSVSLQPWTSIAANDIKKGTTLYIKEIDGLKLPNGMTHNGCVRVDDESWSFGSCHLDWFVLMYETYAEIANKVGEHVKAEQQNCKILDYVNTSTEKWLKSPGNIQASGSSSSSASSSSGSKGSSDGSHGSKKTKSTKKSKSHTSKHHKSKHRKSKHSKRSIASELPGNKKATTRKAHQEMSSKVGQKSSESNKSNNGRHHHQNGGDPSKVHSKGSDQTTPDHCQTQKVSASTASSSGGVNLTTINRSQHQKGDDQSVKNSTGNHSSGDKSHSAGEKSHNKGCESRTDHHEDRHTRKGKSHHKTGGAISEGKSTNDGNKSSGDKPHQNKGGD